MRPFVIARGFEEDGIRRALGNRWEIRMAYGGILAVGKQSLRSAEAALWQAAAAEIILRNAGAANVVVGAC